MMPSPTLSLSSLLLFVSLFLLANARIASPALALAQPTPIVIANVALETHQNLDLPDHHRLRGTQTAITGCQDEQVRLFRQQQVSSSSIGTSPTPNGSIENVAITGAAKGTLPSNEKSWTSDSDPAAPSTATVSLLNNFDNEPSIDRNQLHRRHHATTLYRRRVVGQDVGGSTSDENHFSDETDESTIESEIGNHTTASARLVKPETTIYRRQGLIAHGSSSTPVTTAVSRSREASANVTVGRIVAYPTDLSTPRANLTGPPESSTSTTTNAAARTGISPTGIIAAAIGLGIFVISAIILVAWFILFCRHRRPGADRFSFQKSHSDDVENPKERKSPEAADEKGVVHERVSNLIGPWIVGQKIGEGGSADVFRAKHSETGEDAAIKVIDKSKLDDKALVSIYGEVIILDALRHPNVLKILDLHDFPDRLCIVTELVEDADLFRNVLINGELPTLEQTREWFIQMFLGLEWLHHFDLYHRDLKLENIFVSKARNLVKIGDMGLAAFSHPQDLFSKGCGTMYYMSPEIILFWMEPWRKGFKAAPADVWALGCCLFILLAGYLPFETEVDPERVVPELEADLARIVSGDYTIPENVPEEARDLVSRMLTVDSEARIRMDEIRYHPFLTQGGILPRAQHDDFDLAEEPIGIPDPDVLNEMEVLLRGSKRIEGMIDAIVSPTPTWETRLYFLILRSRANRTFNLDLSGLPEHIPSSVQPADTQVLHSSTVASCSSPLARTPGSGSGEDGHEEISVCSHSSDRDEEVSRSMTDV